jgi:heme-degrading monooxygenase HmoA
LATGTLHVGAPPKTLVDDGERHVVILTVWDADAEIKVYWKSSDGNTRTTIMPGRGIQTFQTAGEFRLEAIGEPKHRVEYGYMLLGLRK